MEIAGRSQQVIVIAHYPDGTTREVTREAVFSTSNQDVAEVKDGLVKGLRRGEAAVLIRYEGIYAACKKYGVDLVGGDTTSSQKGLIISITAIGECNDAVFNLLKR